MELNGAVGSSLERASTSFPLRSGSAQVFSRACDVKPALWDAGFGGGHKDFEYYRLIEDTQKAGFSYRYLVLRDSGGEPIALQPLIMVDQDLSASANSAIRRCVEVGRRIIPRLLRTRMLMAGCLVGDGKLGLVDKAAAESTTSLLSEALNIYARSEKIALITIKDFPIEARELMQPLADSGYTRLDSYPSLTLDLRFNSFDEYMESRLSKVTRKGLRRKLRESAKVSPPIVLEVVQDCSDIIDEIYPLYLAVAKRSAVSFEVFTPEYFLEAGRRMPDRHRYFVWRQAGKAVAFSFCTIWEDTIYDNDIGLDYDVAHELNLYYVTFRDLIEWALAHGFRCYCSAPFNYDAKLHLRLQLVPLDLYVRHTSAIINAFVRRIAPYFSPANSDPVLREQQREIKP